MGEHSVDVAGARFTLWLMPGGAFRQEIETLPGAKSRPPGTCVQEGTYLRTATALTLTFTANSCNRSYEGKTDSDPLVDVTPRGFTTTSPSYSVVYRQR